MANNQQPITNNSGPASTGESRQGGPASQQGRQVRLQTPKRSDGGQVMLLTVLVLSAIFLSATVIAGLLMVNQLSQVAKVADSAKAIFASNAGIERGLFAVMRCNPTPRPIPIGWSESDLDIICSVVSKEFPDLSTPPISPLFYNEASYHLTIEKQQSFGGIPGDHDPTANPIEVDKISSTGRAGRSARALQIDF